MTPLEALLGGHFAALPLRHYLCIGNDIKHILAIGGPAGILRGCTFPGSGDQPTGEETERMFLLKSLAWNLEFFAALDFDTARGCTRGLSVFMHAGL